MSLAILDASNLVLWPYGVSCLLAAVLETSISVVTALGLRAGDDFAFGRLALQVARSLIFVIICLSESWYTLRYRSQKPYEGDETEPLLTNDVTGDASKSDYGSEPANGGGEDDSLFGDIDSDEDEPEEYLKVKQQQKKRLQDSGSWFNYMKEFKIFVPMLWPSKNRFIQFCLLVIAIVLIVERILNVMVPRQLGLIVDDLTAGNGNGVIPFQKIGIWMILSYLNSQAGIYILQSLAELPVEQFAHKRIGAESFKHIMNLSMSFVSILMSGQVHLGSRILSQIWRYVLIFSIALA